MSSTAIKGVKGFKAHQKTNSLSIELNILKAELLKFQEMELLDKKRPINIVTILCYSALRSGVNSVTEIANAYCLNYRATQIETARLVLIRQRIFKVYVEKKTKLIPPIVNVTISLLPSIQNEIIEVDTETSPILSPIIAIPKIESPIDKKSKLRSLQL